MSRPASTPHEVEPGRRKWATLGDSWQTSIATKIYSFCSIKKWVQELKTRQKHTYLPMGRIATLQPWLPTLHSIERLLRTVNPVTVQRSTTTRLHLISVTWHFICIWSSFLSNLLWLQNARESWQNDHTSNHVFWTMCTTNTIKKSSTEKCFQLTGYFHPANKFIFTGQ